MKRREGHEKERGNKKEREKLEERGDPAGCGGFSRFCSLAKHKPCDCRPGRPEKAGDSTEPGPVSGRGLFYSLPAAARSPPLLPPSRPPAEARALATLPPTPSVAPPPPASRKRVA